MCGVILRDPQVGQLIIKLTEDTRLPTLCHYLENHYISNRVSLSLSQAERRHFLHLELQTLLSRQAHFALAGENFRWTFLPEERPWNSNFTYQGRKVLIHRITLNAIVTVLSAKR